MLVTAWYPSSPFTSPPIINSSGRSGIYDVGRSEFRRTRSMVESPLETRISLVVALATQANSLSQRVLSDLGMETARYLFPQINFRARNLEEALMSVPNLETVEFKLIKQTRHYDIRQVEPYFIAETYMPGKKQFDLNGSSQAFNTLAGYLFGKNTKDEEIAMTTPVYTRKEESGGEKMDMTTPVITKKASNHWKMAFVLPSKYGANLPSPKDSSVQIQQVPEKLVAVSAFSGFVTDEEVVRRELKLRDDLRSDPEFQVKPKASIEVAQFNPPFSLLPFTRRNEISMEVERKNQSNG